MRPENELELLTRSRAMHQLLVRGPLFANHCTRSVGLSGGCCVPQRHLSMPEPFLAVAIGGGTVGGKVSVSGGYRPGKQRISE